MSLPVFTIHNGYLRFGLKSIFEGIDVNILEDEHVCLLGRNGQGKSTLLKIFKGIIELDEGTLYQRPNLKVHYLPQDLALPEGLSVQEVVMQSGCPAYEADTLLDALEVNIEGDTKALSGGEKRRVLLARILAGSPDVLLLDEPTNHMDIKGIEWLETYLNVFKGAVVMISHDRRFLSNTSRSLLWLDQGVVRRSDRGYAHFDAWMDVLEQTDLRKLQKIESQLRIEEHWKQRGVTARRKRNQGRLEKLHQLRQRRGQLLSQQTKSVDMTAKEQTFGSQLISEIIDVQKSYEGRLSLGPFSTRIFKGDRIGIIGPNGSGKSTIMKLMIGQIPPDAGRIRLGKSLQLAYFDQERQNMDPNETPWQYLCGGGDTVFVQGEPMHVMGYLKKFLFDDKQARGPMGLLSGGEKNRLHLAKILAQTSNVLVLDEPTNDLDMDTLDLLTALLSDYKGTLILISHDRDFIDQLTTAVFGIQSDGKVIECLGGYTDYEKSLEKEKLAPRVRQIKEPLIPDKTTQKTTGEAKKISYANQRLLDILPDQVTTIEKRIYQVEEEFNNPQLYQTDPVQFKALADELTRLKLQRDTLEEQWLTLSVTTQGHPGA